MKTIDHSLITSEVEVTLFEDTFTIFLRGEGNENIGKLRCRGGILRFEGHLGKSARVFNEAFDDELADGGSIVLRTPASMQVFEIRFDEDGVHAEGSCDRATQTFFEAVAQLRKKSNVD